MAFRNVSHWNGHVCLGDGLVCTSSSSSVINMGGSNLFGLFSLPAGWFTCTIPISGAPEAAKNCSQSQPLDISVGTRPKWVNIKSVSG
jgi:hypothetical protein